MSFDDVMSAWVVRMQIRAWGLNLYGAGLLLLQVTRWLRLLQLLIKRGTVIT